jgi:8-oxo-dGTP diphosphatase
MDRPFQKVVAAIIIDTQNNILITKRPSASHLGGYWEFPGGKIENGESESQALVRELREETGLDICVINKFWGDEFDYDIKIIHLSFFFCRPCSAGQPVEKIEISDFRWIKKEELSNFKFPPADSALIVELMDTSIF